MRVLHVAHHAQPHLGGLEAVLAAETTGLVDRGWAVTLLASATATTPGRRTVDGVRQVRLRAWNGLEERFGVPFPVFGPGLLWAAWREVRRADVVHVHDPLYLTSWAAALCCRLQRVPYVVHRHVGFVHHSSRVVRLVQWLVLATVGRLVLGGAARILPIDEHVRDSLPRAEQARAAVLGNGVDTDRFRPAGRGEQQRLRDDLGLPRAEPLVLFVGRFVPKKGFPLVVAAASDDYRLVFAGGPRPSDLPDERLVFLGAVPAERMPEVYRAVDAFVVASVGECPLTVLEAMASGVPVVLNEDPALHTAWTAGPGVRFADLRRGVLRETLTELLADPERAAASGRAGREHVRRRFSWAAHVDRLEEVYRAVLAERRPTMREVATGA